MTNDDERERVAQRTAAHQDRTAAELGVRNLLARLAQLADGGEIDDYVSLFTDDAVWSVPGNEAVGLAASERRGRDEIRAGALERRAGGIQGPGTGAMHVVTTTAVDVAPDAMSATAASVFLFVTSAPGQAPALLTAGRYADELRRTPDGWRLARRTITFGG